MNSTEILARLISFDTTSANSNLELMNFIGKYLSQHNVKSQLIFNDDKSKANLLEETVDNLFLKLSLF